ncbi:hypothetical protein C7Y69_19425 [Alteromonas sp. KS69]|jgi:hypothetical protein|uniref:hypothetical protein n=1 Tax=Alteromonas sp. KS69 TaxID=2109917 RepID=UPI000C63831C|nr:hypothetical protein [Alteromonas sp. KS69]MBB68198.1 hypothetical protein [Rickettsiales bacterium]RUP75319.1 hypothetical protein C7Y69_19425 [Alteromonas sp. KS69]
MTSYESNSKQVEVQGQLYDSLSAAARAFGLNSDKVLERVRCGWNIYEALEIVERKLPTMNYQNRIEQFAAQEGIKASSVGKRLSLRRRRIREWLNLPGLSPTRHSNALIVTDSEGRTFTSLKEASAEKGMHRSTLKSGSLKLVKVKKYAFESEMAISAESILLLCAHPNLGLKDNLFYSNGHFILLDNQVRLHLFFRNTGDNEYIAFASIDGVTLFSVKCSANGYGISTSSTLFRDTALLKPHEKSALHYLIRGCMKQNSEMFLSDFVKYKMP